MRTKRAFVTIAATVSLSLFGTVLAATAAETGETLPAICIPGGNVDMHGAAASHSMGSEGSMDAAHEDMMKGMDAMNAQMMKGMTAKNIDVAFICGMIPHHLGAVSMARAELTHGKDAFARKLATDVIAAQEKEIAEMLDWLKKQSN